MRKIFFIAIAIIATFVSCTEDNVKVTTQSTGRYAEGYATLDFSVMTSAPGTRAGVFTDDAVIKTLCLVVFDEEGFVSQIAPATLAEPNTVADKNNKRNYKATLALSYEHRVIHFLANIDYTTIPFGTEEETIASLSTTDKYDAYWQKIDMPDGITVKADENGDPVLVDGNMVWDESVKNKLKNIPLIRNYAKFTLSTSRNTSGISISNLDIVAACVVGASDKGAVAPYNRATSEFVTDYDDYDTPAALITAHKYDGCIPEDANPTVYDNSWTDADEKGVCTIYSYERETPTSSPAFILVKGRYGVSQEERDAATPTYYKINLRDANEKYFPILRNYDYKINIHSVAKAGYANVQDAIDGPGSGDISTDLNYLNLTNISNGEARIFVSYTDKVLVSNNKVELKYKFIPDIKNAPTVTANGNVEVIPGDYGYYGKIFVNDESDIKIKSEDSDNYMTVELTPRTPDAYNRTQTIIVRGNYTDAEGNDATISRIVSFTLREKPQITLTCNSPIARKSGTPFPLTISIPGGLSESMFPLNIMIEAKDGTLTPNTAATNPADKNLPVRYGPSMFDASIPGYYFVRQITWDEYDDATVTDGQKSFTAAFKTTVAASATDIIARNEYFFDGEASFINPEVTAKLYYDNNRSTTATDFVTGLPYTYNGTSGYPVVGQSCTLTVYLNGSYDNVTIGGSNASQGSGSYTHTDGVTYTPYRVTNFAAGSTRQTRSLDVKVDGVKIGSVDLKVYGLSLGTSLTSTSFDTKKYYAIKNKSTNNYLNNGNANSSITMSGDLISTALWQFSSTETSYKILSTGTSTNRYIRVNSDENAIRFSDSDSRNQWNFDYNSSRDRFRITYSNNTSYYLIDNGANAAISNSTDSYRNWLIYPVNIVEP